MSFTDVAGREGGRKGVRNDASTSMVKDVSHRYTPGGRGGRKKRRALLVGKKPKHRRAGRYSFKEKIYVEIGDPQGKSIYAHDEGRRKHEP